MGVPGRLPDLLEGGMAEACRQDARVAGEPKPALAGRSPRMHRSRRPEGHQTPDQPPGSKVKYICQATELPNYTQPLKWWDARQYAEDFTSGNISLPRMLRGFLYFAYLYVTQAKRRTFGRPGRWLYDRFQSLWGGVPFPRRAGRWCPERMLRSSTST